MIKQNQVTELSNKFNFNLHVEMPLFLEEINFCFNDFLIDSSMTLQSRMLPIIFILEKSDYLALMNIIFSNLSHNDEKDKYFIHNNRKIEKKEKTIEKKEENSCIIKAFTYF